MTFNSYKKCEVDLTGMNIIIFIALVLLTSIMFHVIYNYVFKTLNRFLKGVLKK